MREINLEEILNADIDWDIFSYRFPGTAKLIKLAMREACEQTLELAVENAMIIPCNSQIDGKTSTELCLKDGRFVIIDEQSILNTINQIK